MGQLLGLPQRGPIARRRPGVGFVFSALAAAAATGCGGDQMVVGEEVDRAWSETALDGEIHPGDVRQSGVPVPAVCPPSPEERQARLGCWPTRHVGRWRGYLIGNPRYETMGGERAEFPIADLLLSIGPFGEARLSFGEPVKIEQPQGPLDPYLCAGSSPNEGCLAAQRIVPGFEYELEGIEILDPALEATPRIMGESPLRIGERLSFGVPIEQPWRAWCELQQPEPEVCPCSEECGELGLGCLRFGPEPGSVDPDACEIGAGASARSVDCGWLAAQTTAPCSCSDAGCFAVSSSIFLSLRMSEDGRALRGSIGNDAVGGVGAAELGGVEFLREGDR